MLFEGVITSHRVDGKCTTDCSIHELQRHQMLGRRRCGIVYVARSASGWLTITDAVESCCQRPSADLLTSTQTGCDCVSRRWVRPVET